MTTEERPIEERARELVLRVRKLLAEGERESALALFNQLHPSDQGEVLVGLAREPQHELLMTLPPGETADILERVQPEEAAEVTEGIASETLSQILDETRPDVAADILKRLPEEQSQETLEAMHGAQQVIPLLAYADDCAGGLMTPEYPVVRE